MKVSLEWLRQYVEFDLSAEEVAARLTAVGLACEGLSQVGADRVLDLEVPSNRPDCLGIVGLARELALVLGRPLLVPAAAPARGGASVASLARVCVEDHELCPRYVARAINGVRIGPSPEWMQRRLASVGLRPVSNVVDVTNYVLFETGQPLHAFDHDLVAERGLTVRRARSGESMKLIDGSEVRFEGSEIVIADAAGPVAMAGVMGGARTEVHAGTVNVLLESAAFLPSAIRRAARRHGVTTESSYRFERSVDWNGVEYASRRAAALIAELAGGSVATGSIDVAGAPPRQAQVTVRYWRVDKLLGQRMEKHGIRRILMDLGMESVYESGEGVTVRVPSFRPDLTREVDMIEEVARHFGYDRIPAETHLDVALPARSPADLACRALREKLALLGFSETVTVSILEREAGRAIAPWRGARPVLLTNPMRAGQDLLRQSLLPSLLEVRRVNLASGRQRLSVFETGRVYLARTDGTVEERRLLGALDDGPDAEEGFRRLRAVLEAACGLFRGADGPEVEPAELPYMEPGESAKVFLKGEFLGVLGRLRSGLCRTFELRSSPAMLELDLDMLAARGLARGSARPLPRFPGVRRDVAVVVDEAVGWAQVAAAAAESQCALRESMEFLNVYRGRQTGPGRKSVAFAVHYRAPDRTLTDEEVNAVHSALVANLTGRLGGALRS